MKIVSVILPCYNGSRWICGAIESVLTQTYKTFELIIVDDGSIDNSKEIITSYLYDKRVKYIYQNNKGFSATINRGIMESHGSLIGFIGQDDIWLKNKLEIQIKYLSDNEFVDIVHSSYYSINSSGEIIKNNPTKLTNYSSRKKLIKHLFLENFLGFETVLVKKKCFEATGFFDERMMGFSDHDMWLRLSGKFNIGRISLPLVKKREHNSQLSKTIVQRGFYDEFLLIKKAIYYYPFLKGKVERKKIANLYYCLGLYFLRIGNHQKAKEELLKAIKNDPLAWKSILSYFAPNLYLILLNRLFP